jgi:hypothetical protein
MTPDDSPPGTPRVTLRTPFDVLALVPFALGFHPERSLVLLTTTPDGRPFHARVDLPEPDRPDRPDWPIGPARPGEDAEDPEDPEDAEDAEDPELLETLARLDLLDHLAEQVATAARVNRAGFAVVVAYTESALLAALAVAALGERLTAHGVDITMALRADGRRWFPVGDPDHPGTPYDVRVHPLTAEGVLAGRVTFASRKALADSLVPCDPRDVEEVAAAAARLLRPPGPAADPTAEAEWLRERVRRPPGDLLDVAEVARALVGLRHVRTRDLAWASMTRFDAPRWVELLREVVRRTPVELVAAPAALLGFAAWLAGDGALAWCAVDRARDADPQHRLAGLVADALEGALPPSAWSPPDAEEIRRAGA